MFTCTCTCVCVCVFPLNQLRKYLSNRFNKFQGSMESICVTFNLFTIFWTNWERKNGRRGLSITFRIHRLYTWGAQPPRLYRWIKQVYPATWMQAVLENHGLILTGKGLSREAKWLMRFLQAGWSQERGKGKAPERERVWTSREGGKKRHRKEERGEGREKLDCVKSKTLPF